jgi:HEAT repeat protein
MTKLPSRLDPFLRSARAAGALLLLTTIAVAGAGCSTVFPQAVATASWTPEELRLAAAIDALVPRILDRDQRESARAELAALGAEAATPLVDRMDHESSAVRWELANVQGSRRDPEAVPALVGNALADPDPHVRWRSLWALGGYDDPAPATARLRDGLASPDEGVRWNAAVGLSVFGSADGLDVLHAGVTSPDPWRRWEAINALGRVHDQETVRVLAPVLLSPVARDRQEAVLVLGGLGGREALVLLVGALHDPLPDVRWRACLALAALGEPAALPPLRALLEGEPAQIVVEHARKAVARLESRG